MSKKVLLFSTRFLEKDGALFCDNNVASSTYCKSTEYINNFLSSNLSQDIIRYFNKIYCISYFGRYQVQFDIEKDLYSEIRDNLWENIHEEIEKEDWDGFFSDLKNTDYLFEIEEPLSKLRFKKREITGFEKEFFNDILKNEGSPLNNSVTLNTDFGDATDKKSIDRRFKIYKLKNEDGPKDVLATYGIWCLGKGDSSKAKSWYKAIYKELKEQMGSDFQDVNEVLLFLHDGDIGEKIPFAVINYKQTFDFLDKNQTMSVAIFQHSLSPISRALSNSNISEALRIAKNAMERGGKRAFLNNLSDYVAYWHDGGKEEYINKVKNEREKFQDINLIEQKENVDDRKFVEDVRKMIKEEIDKLTQKEQS